MKKNVLLVLVAVVAFDQLVKYLADTFVSPSSPVQVLPFFHLVNVKNTGAAFGKFKALGNNFFIAVSTVAIVFITVLLVKGKDGFFGLVLILAGALGNLIDRLLYGHVRDFIDLSVGRYHWPAFNIADSALTIGVLTMIFGSIFRKEGNGSRQH